MSISYPLSLPQVPTIAGGAGNYITGTKVTFGAGFIVAIARSPYSRQAQTYQHQGDGWSAQFDFPMMTRAQASPWIGFLLSLKGQVGYFAMGDPGNKGLLSNAAGTVTVNGGSQTGYTLVVSGLTGTLKAGDYISVGSGATQRLYMNLVDITGAGTLDIFPRLRESPANGASVTLGATAKGVFRLTESNIKWETGADLLCSISFSAEEYI